MKEWWQSQYGTLVREGRLNGWVGQTALVERAGSAGRNAGVSGQLRSTVQEWRAVGARALLQMNTELIKVTVTTKILFANNFQHQKCWQEKMRIWYQKPPETLHIFFPMGANAIYDFVTSLLSEIKCLSRKTTVTAIVVSSYAENSQWQRFRSTLSSPPSTFPFLCLSQSVKSISMTSGIYHGP